MSENIKGEVVYEIRGDDSHLESDLEKAQKKVEQSAEKGAERIEQIEKETAESIKEEKEEVVEHQKKQDDEIVDNHKKSGKKREESEKDTSEKLKKMATDTAKAIGAGFMAVGTAAATVGGMAIKGATDMDQAVNSFLTSTGTAASSTLHLADGTTQVVDQAEKYRTIMEEIYKDNFGESFDDIATSMADVQKQMTYLDDMELKGATESALTLRDVFGYEVSESVRAANSMVDQFGVSADEAFNLIAQGAQNGLDFSGELLDSINEYAPQFKKMGLSAEDMFQVFASGTNAGAFNLDKIGDAVKEMSIRVVDGSEATEAGFAALGMNADEMAEKFAAGGDSAKEAFYEVINGLAAMEDPLAQNAAGVNLFGTMWEDLGGDVITSLAEMNDGIDQTRDSMSELQEVKYDDMGSMLEGLKRTIEMLLIPLGEQLIPILSELIEALLPVLEEALPPLIDLIGEIIEQMSPMIEAILPDLLGLLEVLLPFVTVVFTGMADAVQSCITLIINVLKELILFIQNVFTGNWQAAWENVRNIFQAIADSLKEAFKVPINWIIDKINSFIRGLNKIQIPDWVPGIGGKGFHIPEIPKLRIGMDYVPEDDFPAFLHRGEAVLTAEENARLRELGGIWALHSTAPMYERSNRVTVDNMSKTEPIDYNRLGTAVADALIDGNVRFVVGEREFARLERDLE